jgi:nitric oxide reductase activation protein
MTPDPLQSTGMCYNFVKERLTWVEAREECKLRAGFRERGDLASVNSLQEQLFVHSRPKAILATSAFLFQASSF